MQSFINRHKLLALLFLVGVLLILNLGSLSIRGMFSSFLSPAQSFLWEAGRTSSAFLAGTFQGATLYGRVMELERENLFLTQKLLSFQEVGRENDRLREALGVSSKEEFDQLLSEIIGKETERDVLLLNKGATDGVLKGMPVITQSRVAVGSIGAVFEHTSEVELLSLKDRASDAKIQGKEVIGVLKGEGRYRVLLDLIPKEEELEEGDVVVTSSLGGVFPDDLLVGELQYVQKSDLTAFQGGAVKPFFQIQKDNSLFILRNYP